MREDNGKRGPKVDCMLYWWGIYFMRLFFLQLEQSGKNMEEIRDKIVEVEGMDINFDMLFDEYMCSLYRGKGCLIINIYVMRHNLSYLNFS